MGSLFDACRPFAVAGIISDEIRCPDRSALPPKADIRPRDHDVCFGPIPDQARRSKISLLFVVQFESRLKLSVFLSLVAKIAMARALHNGLCAREREIWIEAVDHSVVAIAMNEVAQFGETKLLIELRIPAARYVKVEPVVVCSKYLDIETATSGPNFFGNHLE
jgi:hypothetical protein